MWTSIRVALARIRGFFRADHLEHEFDQELATHLAMAEEDKIRQGLTPREARRQARVELGGLTQLREAGRAARGLPWLGTFWLDAKLGFRMLRKSWGLTLVGGLAMTVAIGIGAAVFAFFDIVYSGTLPLEEGDRVIALETWDEQAQRRHPTSLRDFERWRDRLRSVEDIGAFQTIERNLILGDGQANPVPTAEMTAAGFRLARVAPLLGRPLTLEDELATAPPVVVIGYDVWQSRFAADPTILGQTLRLGDTVYTVVGVMPEGFAFPVQHRFWTPLRPDPSARHQDDGPFELIFGRLAPGATLEGAQAELTSLGFLPSTATTAPDKQLRPRVTAYVFGLMDDQPGQVKWVSRLILFCVALFLIPPCANIAILIYARTVTRQEEFAARFVLGASRSRIVVQIFIEVLVLAAAASGLALMLIRVGASQLERRNPDAPFWIDFSLTFETILFTAGLAVFAAVIAGVVPALRATGRQMQSGFNALGSRTGMQLGKTWTVLVVAQVAFSAAALPSAVELAWGTLRTGMLGPGFAAEEYLTARIAVDRELPAKGVAANRMPVNTMSAENSPRPFAARFASYQTELVRQLRAEAGVSGVTLAAAVPGEEAWATIEVEGIPQPDTGIFGGINAIQVNRVDDAFLDVFGIPILLGRGFDSRDLESERASVIVDRTFVEKHIGGANPLGQRVRYSRKQDRNVVATPTSREDQAGTKGPTASPSATSPSATSPSGSQDSRIWYEIVGVVAAIPATSAHGKMYHPMVPGQTHPASLTVHTASAPIDLVDRLRSISTALDPTLRVDEVLPLDVIYSEQAVGNNIGATALGAITLCVLLLSGAGLYALMSFTVNQRRREIGIRSALGAQPRRLITGIFRRAMSQVAAGALVGVLIALLITHYFPIELVGGWSVPGVVPAAAALMILIGLVATTGPARRGLRVDPIEELREG